MLTVPHHILIRWNIYGVTLLPRDLWIWSQINNKNTKGALNIASRTKNTYQVDIIKTSLMATHSGNLYGPDCVCLLIVQGAASPTTMNPSVIYYLLFTGEICRRRLPSKQTVSLPKIQRLYSERIRLGTLNAISFRTRSLTTSIRPFKKFSTTN